MTPLSRFLLFLSLVFCAAAPSWAAEIAATCVSVADGDTIVVNSGEEQFNVRLNGIDAPELSQEYGDKSKAVLERLVKGKQIRLTRTGMDAYGRMVADVACGGTDINLSMVRQGAAWHYKRYSSDATLAEAERLARRERSGLWEAPNPTPPWEYTQDTVRTAEGPFWISNTGKVHNSTCHWFRNCKGVEADSPAGEDCKSCGGRTIKPKTRKKR